MKNKKMSIDRRGKLVATLVVLSGVGCGQISNSQNSTSKSQEKYVLDSQALEKAESILTRFPQELDEIENESNLEDLSTEYENLDQLEEVENSNSSSSNSSAKELGLKKYDQQELLNENRNENTSSIPEEDAAHLMKFVDEVSVNLIAAPPFEIKVSLTPHRYCSEDGTHPVTKKYYEAVHDQCLMPKMQTASQIFSIRHNFARCIFEQENRQRDRLAHNQNGNGLAQIVNTTMREISKRWKNGDSLAMGLEQCLQNVSSRQDSYLFPIDGILVPSSYVKSDILHEASSRAPSNRVNPLYRDDSVCLGLMTMGIKVQEARGRKGKPVSDTELARRYNGSKLQQRYARAVVKCVAKYSRSGMLAENGSIFDGE